MTGFQQEVMTMQEAARWFRRSTSWLRLQTDLLRLVGPGGLPLFHIRLCRTYILGRLCGLQGVLLRQAQVRALAVECGLEQWPQLAALEQGVGAPPQPEQTAASGRVKNEGVTKARQAQGRPARQMARTDHAAPAATRRAPFKSRVCS